MTMSLSKILTPLSPHPGIIPRNHKVKSLEITIGTKIQFVPIVRAVGKIQGTIFFLCWGSGGGGGGGAKGLILCQGCFPGIAPAKSADLAYWRQSATHVVHLCFEH